MRLKLVTAWHGPAAEHSGWLVSGGCGRRHSCRKSRNSEPRRLGRCPGQRPPEAGPPGVVGPFLTLLRPLCRALPRPSRWPLLWPPGPGGWSPSPADGCARTPVEPSVATPVPWSWCPLCYRCSTNNPLLNNLGTVRITASPFGPPPSSYGERRAGGDGWACRRRGPCPHLDKVGTETPTPTPDT